MLVDAENTRSSQLTLTHSHKAYTLIHALEEWPLELRKYVAALLWAMRWECGWNLRFPFYCAASRLSFCDSTDAPKMLWEKKSAFQCDDFGAPKKKSIHNILTQRIKKSEECAGTRRCSFEFLKSFRVIFVFFPGGYVTAFAVLFNDRYVEYVLYLRISNFKQNLIEKHTCREHTWKRRRNKKLY